MAYGFNDDKSKHEIPDVLPIAKGGTGETDEAAARAALGATSRRTLEVAKDIVCEVKKSEQAVSLPPGAEFDVPFRLQKDGYTPIAVHYKALYNKNIVFCGFSTFDGAIEMGGIMGLVLRNTHATNIVSGIRPEIYVVYIKNDLLNK